MAYQSQIARGALRHALRNHPGDLVGALHGRMINNLSLVELKSALITLGSDPEAIVATALKAKDDCDAAIAETRGNETAEIERDMETMINSQPGTSEDESEDAAIEAEMQSIRSLIATGGFSAFDDRLRGLVIDARKPPVEIRVEVPVEASAGATSIHIAKPTGKHATWSALFGVTGPLGQKQTMLWDGSHPHTPAINDRYLWPAQTTTALTQIARGKNVMLYGPAGTGKTEFAQQLAAKTGRPFALISCDNGTDAATLTGMTTPDANGGVTWQDGQLTRAIKTPGCVICIDEPSIARPGALFVFQNVLQGRVLFIAETGQRVPVAHGVIFIATDNTNGTGGGARRGYTDTNRLNTAFLDRFGSRVHIDYMAPDSEANIIAGYTGCTLELAKLLVSAATVTRAAANDQTLSHGIGLRRLLAWAELLTDGIDPADAFNAAILNCAPEQDVETLREQCLLAYDAHNVAQALKGTTSRATDPTIANPSIAGRAAARDFAR